jgi:hypothetical protein
VGTETRITVNGQVADASGLVDALEQAAPVEPYMVVVAGKAVEAIMWDGVAQFDPGAGAELVRAAGWNGSWPTAADPPGVAAQRDVEGRLDRLVANLRDDLRAFDGMTPAQRVAAQRRALRGLLLVARMVRGDFTGADE